nr:SLC13 family permease [Planosporangium thailandense]
MIPVLFLVAVLGFAVARPCGLPEAVAAVPAALVVLALGLVTWPDAIHEMASLGPTVGFLAAILVLAHLADVEGVFRYAGGFAARLSGGSPRRLLAVVFAVAAAVTAVLSLDATVVLLTPVVFATAATVGVRPRPHVYACTHLANSASLLLPVSNLTNLLAFAASGLSFGRFTALMAVPWLAALAVEYVVFRRFFAADLSTPRHAVAPEPVAVPAYALTVLAVVLAGFVVLEPLGVHPAFVALAGVLALTVRHGALAALGRTGDLVRAANPAFLAFVLALGIVVLAVRRSGLGAIVAHLVPRHGDLAGLFVMAALAALLANLLNNLPATLMLVPLVAHSPALVLAALIGVNIGPNLTYVGSLATLLWRQVLHARNAPPSTVEFLRLGALTVAPCLAAAVAGLWVGLRLWGS